MAILENVRNRTHTRLYTNGDRDCSLSNRLSGIAGISSKFEEINFEKKKKKKKKNDFLAKNIWKFSWRSIAI